MPRHGPHDETAERAPKKRRPKAARRRRPWLRLPKIALPLPSLGYGTGALLAVLFCGVVAFWVIYAAFASVDPSLHFRFLYGPKKAVREYIRMELLEAGEKFEELEWFEAYESKTTNKVYKLNDRNDAVCVIDPSDGGAVAARLRFRPLGTRFRVRDPLARFMQGGVADIVFIYSKKEKSVIELTPREWEQRKEQGDWAATGKPPK